MSLDPKANDYVSTAQKIQDRAKNPGKTFVVDEGFDKNGHIIQ